MISPSAYITRICDRARTLRLAAWTALVALSWSGAVGAAQYEFAEGAIDVVGAAVRMKASYEDTFVALGRSHGLGYDELVAANPAIDPWLPGEGVELMLPSLFVLPDTPREGIVLNLAEKRLYFYPPGASEGIVFTFPISIGDVGANTPVVRTRIVDKVIDPAWYPPASIIAEHRARGDELPRIVPPGPDNPLGRFAFQLGIPSYLIHATNRPAGIGMRVSHGCIRMLTDDIAFLFDEVPRGMPVNIVNQPYKLGWYNDTLFLEVHAPLADHKDTLEVGMNAVVRLLVKHTQQTPRDIDWQFVEQILTQASGVPVPISVRRRSAVDAVAGADCLLADGSSDCDAAPASSASD